MASELLSRALAAIERDGRQIVIGQPIEVLVIANNTSQPRDPMQNTDPSAKPAGPSKTANPSSVLPGVVDAASSAKLKAIAKLLSVNDPSDSEAMTAALAALYLPTAAAATVVSTSFGLASLSAREVRLCKESGVSLRTYAENRIKQALRNQ